MKHLLSSVTKTTLVLSILWSIVSWSIQIYLGIPLWWSLLGNLFFAAIFCLKYPADGQRNLNFSDDWLLISSGAFASFATLRWVKNTLAIPLWGYYLALVFSIIILERILIEFKKLINQ